MSTRVPLDLTAELTGADGTRYKWDANQAPGSRPQNLSFRTKVGEGFSDASLSLPRRIDRDYPDLNLADTLTITGADGWTAYEGDVTAMPRELTDRHSIGVQLAGAAARLKDRKFTEIYVDRDMGAWRGMTARRKTYVLGTNSMPISDGVQATDPVNSQATLSTAIQGAWSTPYKPLSEAWYDAGAAQTVGRVAYAWKIEGPALLSTDLNWQWYVTVSSDDNATAFVGTANLRAAGPQALTSFTPTARYRYVILQLLYNATPAGAAGNIYSIAWNSLAVYGNHGLPLYTGETGQPEGVYASDVIKNIVTRWCPQLDTSGVQQTNYVIQHLAFKDPTFPYDALLEVNKYHLWHLGVWEGRRLDFKPYDLTDYDWEIRSDDPGTTISLQGPSTDNLANGIVVTYSDLLTGIKTTLTPDVYPDLADTSTTNPYNAHGRQHWTDIALSSPTTQAAALQLGRAALADKNTPKTPGTITVRGYVRDRAGNPQPVWKVRAGDAIAITNYPNDAPRLIVETDYNDEQKTVSIAVDQPFARLDAYLDRQQNALAAAGLA